MSKVNTMNKQDIAQRFFDAVLDNLRYDIYEQVKHIRKYGDDEGLFTEEELEFIYDNRLDDVVDYAVTDALDYASENAGEVDFVKNAFEQVARLMKEGHYS